MSATGSDHAFRGPPLHLLVYALREQLTGTVAVETMSGEEHLVYFHEGAPAKVLLAQPLLALDSIIVRMGAVDAADLVESVRIAYEHGMLLGRILVSRSLISERTLEEALRWQVQEKVSHLLELSDRTRYQVFRDQNQLEGYGGNEITPVDPLCMLLHAARLDASVPAVDRQIAVLRDMTLALAEDAPIERLCAVGEELQALALLASGPQTYESLVAHGITERAVKSVLFALSSAELIEDAGEDDEVPPAADWASTSDELAVLPPWPPEPGGGASEPPPWSDTHGVMHGGSANAPVSSWPPHAAEGPPSSREGAISRSPASERRVEAPAFVSYAAPPPLGTAITTFELDDDRAPVSSRSGRVIEPARPGLAESLRQRFFGGSSNDEPPAAAGDEEGAHSWCMADFDRCNAAEAFGIAEEALKVHDFERAFAAISQAAAKEPSNTTYRAMQAYVSARKKGTPPSGREATHFAPELAVLTDIIVREPNFELPVYFRARLFKQARNFKRAIEDFEMCTLLNPSNVDAAREVREYESAKERRRDSQPSAPSSKRGFFDWFSTGEWKKSTKR
jgi:hypothetical protein